MLKEQKDLPGQSSSGFELVKLVNADAVAECLGVSRARVFELVRLKLLPCIRLGRQLRFDPMVIDAWIASGGKALPGGWRREPKGGLD